MEEFEVIWTGTKGLGKNYTEMGKIIDKNEGELQTEQRKGEIKEKAEGNGRGF